MKWQPVLLGSVLLAASVWPAMAFKVDIHRSITAAALKTFMFSPTAIFEIQNANECVDVGPTLFSSDDQADAPCLPENVSIDQQLGAPEDHFDDEQFVVGIVAIRAKKAQILMMINERRYTQARKLLGSATHSIQDFYAHSNWVELGNQDIFTGIDSGSTPLGDTRPGSLHFAGEREDVCQFTNVSQYDRVTGGVRTTKSVSSSDLLPATSKGGTTLTSGYFFASTPDNVAKCTHGAIFDGINKDTPTTKHGKTYHAIARQLATKHTTAYILDILRQLNGNEEAIRGLTKALAYVYAARTNETGIQVSQGDKYRFTTPPNQRIIWGYDGILFGRPFFAGPEGVDARGYIGYLTPPVPNRGVGALILEIMPPSTCMTVNDADPLTTARVGATPCPSTYAYIGLGGDITMPATGTLFLRVNDAYLGNNSGHFETELTLIEKAKTP